MINEHVRSVLIEIARKQGIISYQELSDKCGLGLNMLDNPSDRLEIGGILGDISEFEFDNKRPLLSVVVRSKKDGSVGEGFFELCENLEIISDSEKLNKDEKEEFEIKELNKCHGFWRDEVNYKLYKDNAGF